MKRGDRGRNSKRLWAKVSKKIEVSRLREVLRNIIITETTLKQRETGLEKEMRWSTQMSLQMKSIIRRTAKKKESDLTI
jgi:hypothetical protein